MNSIPRMDDSLLCRLMNVRIIGAGRLPREDLQTVDDAIEAIKASDLTEKSLSQEAWTWSKACENACKSDYAAREHLRLAIDHIAALKGALEDLASLGATVAICGTKYDDAAARECLLPATAVTGPSHDALLAASPQPQPVQAQPSDVDFEAKTCPEAFLQQEIAKLKASLATTVSALEMGLQIGDQCSRGFLAKFHKKTVDALAVAQPKPAKQQKDHQ